MIVIANVFPKLETVKIFVRAASKSAASEQALTVNMWKRPKYLWNLNDSAFVMFFHQFTGRWFGKFLP